MLSALYNVVHVDVGTGSKNMDNRFFSASYGSSTREFFLSFQNVNHDPSSSEPLNITRSLRTRAADNFWLRGNVYAVLCMYKYCRIYHVNTSHVMYMSVCDISHVKSNLTCDIYIMLVLGRSEDNCAVNKLCYRELCIL